jgi:dihydroorotase
MAELLDMYQSGAVAFTDGKQTVYDAGLLLRTLQYLTPINGLVMNQSMDRYLSQGGLMHEGICSTRLGMKGIPSLAEDIAVRRDLEILEFAGGRLHFANISTAGAVSLIRTAKANGLKVTASVSPMHLCFNDEMLADFDSNYKVMPPLRSENDRHALLAGVLDGTIDVINSQHIPLDTEQMMCEFPYAGFGVTMLETAFSLCQTHLSNVVTTDVWVEKASISPRKLLGLAMPVLEPGSAADLTFFSPNETWFYEKPFSKSYNSPLLGQTLKGKVF